MSFKVSRYEATGTTPAKRAPLDINRPITVENDEVLFENYKEPVFNDTLEPEEVDFREKKSNFLALNIGDGRRRIQPVRTDKLAKFDIRV